MKLPDIPPKFTDNLLILVEVCQYLYTDKVVSFFIDVYLAFFQNVN